MREPKQTPQTSRQVPTHVGIDCRLTVGATGFVRHNDLLLAAEHAERLIAAGIDSLDAIFTLQSDRPLGKPGLDPWRERLFVDLGLRTTQSAVDNRQSTIRLPPTRVYIKRFRRPPRRASREVAHARCGAKSLAGLEWIWLCEFARCGIPTAQPLAFGEELRGNRELRSAVVIAEAPGESLEKIMKRAGRLVPPLLRALVEEMATLAGRMHAHGLVHRDLYLPHVFFDSAHQTTVAIPHECADAKVRFGPITGSLCLIDLQRALRPQALPWRWFVKDLAALNYSAPPEIISRTDRLRFLCRYLESHIALAHPPPAKELTSKRHLRRLFYRVLGKTSRIAKHDRARSIRLGAYVPLGPHRIE